MADEKSGHPDKQAENRQRKTRPPTKTSWKPGRSGNPKGRPPLGKTMADVYRAVLDEISKSGEPFKVVYARSCLMHAIKGNAAFAKEINNRVEGLPKHAEDMGEDESIDPIIFLEEGLGIADPST